MYFHNPIDDLTREELVEIILSFSPDPNEEAQTASSRTRGVLVFHSGRWWRGPCRCSGHRIWFRQQWILREVDSVVLGVRLLTQVLRAVRVQ